MSDETDAGASYLAALKRSIAAQAGGAAAARAPEKTDLAEPAVAGLGLIRPRLVEKRRSPRYPCQGSARLQENGNGVVIWATVTDISMNGCYMENTAIHRVGAIFDLKLDINNFHIETTGEVRVAYPQLGIGMSFARMSSDNRERLQKLLRSISPSLLPEGAEAKENCLSRSEALARLANPGSTLQAMRVFFADRQTMSREDFERLLRKS